MNTDHNTIITHTHIYIGKIIEPYVHSVVNRRGLTIKQIQHIIVVQVEMSKRGVTSLTCYGTLEDVLGMMKKPHEDLEPLMKTLMPFQRSWSPLFAWWHDEGTHTHVMTLGLFSLTHLVDYGWRHGTLMVGSLMKPLWLVTLLVLMMKPLMVGKGVWDTCDEGLGLDSWSHTYVGHKPCTMKKPTCAWR